MRKEVKELYKSYGVDVDYALKRLHDTKISIQCWQMDDVIGFENNDSLTGGIQTTGNYPGRARNFKELTEDLEFALKYIPGSKKINLHANYQVEDIVDRRDVTPHQFAPWVKWAKENGLGLDFNPTMFSSPMLKDNMTLSSPIKEVRD
jgi:L-rhamnose isomerase